MNIPSTPFNEHGLASFTQWLALRERLSEPNEQEQEEQEYLAELIEIERDPEDRRPKSRRPASQPNPTCSPLINP
jgi:hypothetical protein